MTHRALLSACIATFVAISLACSTPAVDEPATQPPAPPPDEPGFGALFEQDDPAPRPRSGDTAEPKVQEPIPADAPPSAPAPVPTTASTAAVSPPSGANPPSPTTAVPEPTTAAPEPAASSYRAIVAFYGGSEPEAFSSAVAGLRSSTSGTGIQVILAPVGADTISVDGGRVDIGAFRAARDAGFVFSESGRQSVFAHYPPETPISASAGRYFGVSL